MQNKFENKIQNTKIKCKYADRHNQKRQQNRTDYYFGGGHRPPPPKFRLLLSLLIVSVCVIAFYFLFYFFILYFIFYFIFLSRKLKLLKSNKLLKNSRRTETITMLYCVREIKIWRQKK